MNISHKNLIMFIGRTHSGKTTFAHNLSVAFPNMIVLEADPIAVFMKEKFPKLRELDDREHSGMFKEISLKFRTFLLFVEFALSLDRTVLLSNSNMWVEGRRMVFELCKKFNYNIIGVYFDLDESVLVERVLQANRSKDVLRETKDFQELIIKQRSRMQVPDPTEFNDFLIIKSEDDLKMIKEKLTPYLCN